MIQTQDISARLLKRHRKVIEIARSLTSESQSMLVTECVISRLVSAAPASVVAEAEAEGWRLAGPIARSLMESKEADRAHPACLRSPADVLGSMDAVANHYDTSTSGIIDDSIQQELARVVAATITRRLIAAHPETLKAYAKSAGARPRVAGEHIKSPAVPRPTSTTRPHRKGKSSVRGGVFARSSSKRRKKSGSNLRRSGLQKAGSTL